MGPRIPWILKEQWDSVYSSWSDILVINDILSFMQKQGKFKLWSKHARLPTCIMEITKSRNCNPFFRAGISFISQVSSGDRKQKNDSSTPKFEFYLVPGKPYFECGDYLWGGGFGFGEISKIFGELSTRMNQKKITTQQINSHRKHGYRLRNSSQILVAQCFTTHIISEDQWAIACRMYC